MKNNIRVNRATNKISQEELAKMVGVSRQTINAIENNKYFPSLELGLKLSKVLKCSVNELFRLGRGITSLNNIKGKPSLFQD